MDIIFGHIKKLFILVLICILLYSSYSLFNDIENKEYTLENINYKNNDIINSIESNDYKEYINIISKNTYKEYTEHNELFGMNFTVQIIDTTDKNCIAITSTEDSIRGKIILNITDDNNIKPGCLYNIDTTSLIEISDDNYPIVDVLSIKGATDDEIENFDKLISNKSNYKDRIALYKTMSIDEIINDANEQYVFWTQKEIKSYEKYLSRLNLKKATIKSIVKTREEFMDELMNTE